MTVYYEKDTSHDKDTLDTVEMRRSDFFRQGKHQESVFKKKKEKYSNPRRERRESNSEGTIGSFEVFTKGVGSKIMTSTGWKTGEGLGKDRKGISTPIIGEEEGQMSRDKSGLGYYGEKVVFTRPSPGAPKSGYKFVRPPPPGSRITTAYSGKLEQDPGERVDRSNPPIYMKFRDHPVKFCKGGVEGGS